jgi:hypothetical protein
MNPLLIQGLMSFGPALLSRLGLFGGDPQAELRKKMMRLMSPENQAKMTNQFYQQAVSSPAFQQAMGGIAAGANATAGRTAAELGARGIGTSGTGAIMSSLTPSITGSQIAGLRTNAFGQAQNQAMKTLQDQLSALTGTSGPSQTRQLAGMGLDAFGPMLQEFLRTKYPGTFGGAPKTG